MARSPKEMPYAGDNDVWEGTPLYQSEDEPQSKKKPRKKRPPRAL